MRAHLLAVVPFFLGARAVQNMESTLTRAGNYPLKTKQLEEMFSQPVFLG
jgi:hypothetical protein